MIMHFKNFKICHQIIKWQHHAIKKKPIRLRMLILLSLIITINVIPPTNKVLNTSPNTETKPPRQFSVTLALFQQTDNNDTNSDNSTDSTSNTTTQQNTTNTTTDSTDRNTTSETTTKTRRETDYAAEFTFLVLAALDLIVRLIVLGLVAAAIIWWIFWVFRVFPEFLADVGRRSEEAYGKIGLFIYVLIMAPSLLVFLIKTLLRVVQLLMQAILEFLARPLFVAAVTILLVIF